MIKTSVMHDFNIVLANDYTTTQPFQVSFSRSSSTSKSFEVTIVDDSIVEPREFFTLYISGHEVMDSNQNAQNLTDLESSRISVGNNMTKVIITNSNN